MIMSFFYFDNEVKQSGVGETNSTMLSFSLQVWPVQTQNNSGYKMGLFRIFSKSCGNGGW